MTQQIIHFSHANGFPAGSYTQMLAHFKPKYAIGCIERIGHNPKYPVTNNWTYLPQELIDYCEQHYHQPVILMGHSLGAVISFIVAAKRPDLVKALVMIDAPIPTLAQNLVLKLAKRVGFIDHITPAARTENRRTHWANKEEALEYFDGKRLMHKFDPLCLRDYIENGTHQAPQGGVELCFSHAIEMQIYRGLPDNIWHKKPLACPSAIFAGAKSEVFWQANARRMQKLGMQLDWTDAGHMFPLEQPKATADKIKRFLDNL